MFNAKKYTLLEPEKVKLPTGETVTAQRVQALRDIPVHNVKAGETGGYVTHKNILSHKDEAWIAGNAIVANKGFGRSGVSGNSLVKDNAYVTNSVLKDSTFVSGNTQVRESVIVGNVIIENHALISDSYLNSFKDPGAVIIINGDAMLWHSNLYGAINICDKAKVSKMKLDASVGGKISIMDSANVSETEINTDRLIKTLTETDLIQISGNASLINPRIHGARNIGGKQNAQEPKGAKKNLAQPAGKPRPESTIAPMRSVAPPVPDLAYELRVISDIENDYAAYTTDIVNLIRYPAMADATVPETRDLMRALRNAKRAVDGSDKALATSAVRELENAFIIAENRAQTLTATYMDDKSQKNLKKAEQLLKIAIDEAAADNERSSGFKAGLKALEGIVPVSEIAIENFKVKNGLLQLEA